MKKENSLKINPAEKKNLSIVELLPKALAVFTAAFGFSAMLSGSIGYTSKLTEYVIQESKKTAAVLAVL